MKYLISVAAIVLSAQGAFGATTGIKGVYGTDDRKDLYQISNSLHLTLAKSNAGMIHKGMFTKGASDSVFDLNPKYLATLEEAANLCTSEKFAKQMTAPRCSGFLIGPDTLITAGHCYASDGNPAKDCNDYAWVFDYDLASASKNPTKNIPMTNIYLCKSISSVKLDNNYDFAIVKLDRKVVGRTPLKLRTTGKIDDKAKLIVIGHPNGLPTKIGSGTLTKNSDATRFSTNLDTFHGNSGSAVFDSSTGVVEGILIQGKNDYTPSIPKNPKSCQVVNRCDNEAKNCSAGLESGPVLNGEVVLRIQALSAEIKKALSK